jgi:putative NADPH-quinone reductase
VASTTGATKEEYSEEGYYGVSFENILAPMKMLAKYTGMHWQKPFAIYDCIHVTEEELASGALQYQALAVVSNQE